MPKYTITIRENGSEITLSLDEFYQIMKLTVPDIKATSDNILEIKNLLAKKNTKRKLKEKITTYAEPQITKSLLG